MHSEYENSYNKIPRSHCFWYKVGYTGDELKINVFRFHFDWANAASSSLCNKYDAETHKAFALSYDVINYCTDLFLGRKTSTHQSTLQLRRIFRGMKKKMYYAVNFDACNRKKNGSRNCVVKQPSNKKSLESSTSTKDTWSGEFFVSVRLFVTSNTCIDHHHMDSLCYCAPFPFSTT
jgi:hypothetical protein